MILMKIMGGFASQLCKFILGYNLAQMHNLRYMLDLSDYAEGYYRPYVLHYVKLPEIKVLYDKKDIYNLQNRIIVRNSIQMKKIDAAKKKYTFHIICEEKDIQDFLAENANIRVTTQNRLIQQLDLASPSKYTTEFEKSIRNETSIAIHVRRGDFATLGWADNINYFKAVIGKFFSENKIIKFYFFSDDIQWCKEKFGYNKIFNYIHLEDGSKGDIEELFCMSYCNVRVLSKFSSYGILANILAGRRGKFSYAIIDGGTSLEEVKELKLSDPLMKRHIDTANSFIKKGISFSDKGYITYWDDTQTKEWVKRYDELGLNYKRCRDNDKNRESIKKRSILSINPKTFLLISFQNWDRWKVNGLYKVGIMLAEKGDEVYYINVKKICNKVENSSRKQKFDLFDLIEGIDGKKYKMYGVKSNISFKDLDNFWMEKRRKAKNTCILLSDKGVPLFGNFSSNNTYTIINLPGYGDYLKTIVYSLLKNKMIWPTKRAEKIVMPSTYNKLNKKDITSVNFEKCMDEIEQGYRKIIDEIYSKI